MIWGGREGGSVGDFGDGREGRGEDWTLMDDLDG